jgi:hypothetical protein
MSFDAGLAGAQLGGFDVSMPISFIPSPIKPLDAAETMPVRSKPSADTAKRPKKPLNINVGPAFEPLQVAVLLDLDPGPLVPRIAGNKKFLVDLDFPLADRPVNLRWLTEAPDGHSREDVQGRGAPN